MGLGKQQKLHADAKAIEKINFTGNLTRFGEAGMFFIIYEVKEPVLVFLKEQLRYYDFISFYWNINMKWPSITF